MTPDDVIAVAGDYVDWGDGVNDTTAHIWFDSDLKPIKKPKGKIILKAPLTESNTKYKEFLEKKFKGDPYNVKTISVKVYTNEE